MLTDACDNARIAWITNGDLDVWRFEFSGCEIDLDEHLHAAGAFRHGYDIRSGELNFWIVYLYLPVLSLCSTERRFLRDDRVTEVC